MEKDHSDRKTIENLVQKLMDAQKQASESPKPIKESPGSTKRKGRKKGDTSSKKSMDRWLRSGRCQLDIKVQPATKSTSDENKNIVEDTKKTTTKKTTKTSTKSKKKPVELKRSKSFDRYGVVLPSIDDVLAKQKEYDEHNNAVENLLELCDKTTIPIPDNKNVKNSSPAKRLNCYYLTSREIQDAFEKFSTDLRDIMSEKISCERHDSYFNSAITLKGCPSLLAFTKEQKSRLIDLMHSRFDPEDKSTNYYFQVLLPELCYMIFMEEHDMDREQAENYLDKASTVASSYLTNC